MNNSRLHHCLFRNPLLIDSSNKRREELIVFTSYSIDCCFVCLDHILCISSKRRPNREHAIAATTFQRIQIASCEQQLCSSREVQWGHASQDVRRNPAARGIQDAHAVCSYICLSFIHSMRMSCNVYRSCVNVNFFPKYPSHCESLPLVSGFFVTRWMHGFQK
jgi:hypothetical protein